MQGSATPGGVEIIALRAKNVYLFRHLVSIVIQMVIYLLPMLLFHQRYPRYKLL